MNRLKKITINAQQVCCPSFLKRTHLGTLTTNVYTLVVWCWVVGQFRKQRLLWRQRPMYVTLNDIIYDRRDYPHHSMGDNKYRESWELTMFNVRKGIDFKYNCTILRTTVCLQWLVCSLRWQPAMMFTWCSLLLPFIAWLYSIKSIGSVWWLFGNKYGGNTV